MNDRYLPHRCVRISQRYSLNVTIIARIFILLFSAMLVLQLVLDRKYGGVDPIHHEDNHVTRDVHVDSTARPLFAIQSIQPEIATKWHMPGNAYTVRASPAMVSALQLSAEHYTDIGIGEVQLQHDATVFRVYPNRTALSTIKMPVVNYTMMVFQRFSPHNLWHFMAQTVYYAWLTLVQAGHYEFATDQFHDRQRIHLVFTDDHALDGPFDKFVWSHLTTHLPIAGISAFRRDFPDPVFIQELIVGITHPWRVRPIKPFPHLNAFRRWFSASVRGIAPSQVFKHPRKTGTCSTHVVLVSRDAGTTRIIVNIDTVAGWMKEEFQAAKTRGIHIHVTVARLGRLSFPAQVKLWNSADVAVGLHGAGMAGAILMPAGSALVEVTQREFLRLDCRELAHDFGLGYTLYQEQRVTDAARVLPVNLPVTITDREIFMDRVWDGVAHARHRCEGQ